MFAGRIIPLLCCLIGLPIIAGGFTREGPFVTSAILAFGSVLPLNDVPPIPSGLWAFYWTWAALREGKQSVWAVLIIQFPIALAFAAVAFAVMFMPTAALVLLGWYARLGLMKHHNLGASRSAR